MAIVRVEIYIDDAIYMAVERRESGLYGKHSDAEALAAEVGDLMTHDFGFADVED